MSLSVVLSRLSRFGPERDVPKKQIAIKFALNIYSLQRMIPNDIVVLLTAGPSGQNFHLYTKDFKSNGQIALTFIQHARDLFSF